MTTTEYKKPGALTFLLLLTGAMFLIWYPEVFVTGDGPCHVHNAIAWREMWFHNNAFYTNFYELNPSLSPNYTSHVLLAVLTLVFKPIVAEKVLLSVYAWGFILGFLKLHEQLKAKNSVFLPLVLVLTFQSLLYLGFYNFILSIVFYQLMMAWYIKQIEKPKPSFWLKLSIAMLVLYFTHLAGLFLFLLSIGVHMLTTTTYKSWFWRGSKIVLACLPALWLTVIYITHQPKAVSTHYLDTDRLKIMLREASVFQVAKSAEAYYTQVIFWICLFGLVWSLFQVAKKKQWNKSWPFILLIFFIGAYFVAPENAFGGEQLKQRIQWITYLYAVLLISLIELPRWIRWLSVGLSIVLVVSLCKFQWRYMKQTNQLTQRLRAVSSVITTHSTVLPLCFNTFGEMEGKTISDFGRHNNHLGELIQGNKDIVFMDNYEANTTYFPLRYKNDINPFIFLGDQEAKPPVVSLTDYTKRCAIDYILLFNLTENDRRSDAYQHLILEMNGTYRNAYSDTDSSVLLFKRMNETL